MPSVTYEDLARHHPDILLPPEPEFRDPYLHRSLQGRVAAANRTVAFLAICRNAMPWLPRTLALVQETGELFKDWRAFIFENDSVDGTKDVLASLGPRFSVSMTENGRPHLNYTKTSDRTVALAEYRNKCREWAAEHCRDFDYAIVFDTDPWGGWSIEGVANTIGHLEDENYSQAAGMGSYSWAVWGPPICPTPTVIQYDGWACRWNWWKERQDMNWFHLWHPPVGSEPVKMNSCFGQLAVYRMGNYLQGVYQGGDCEHVAHWRTCGGTCFLNPSQRVVSFWIPQDDGNQEGGRLHGDVLQDVAGGNADTGHCRDPQDIG